MPNPLLQRMPDPSDHGQPSALASRGVGKMIGLGAAALAAIVFGPQLLGDLSIRASEGFERRADAELVERALSDYDPNK